MVLTPLNYSKIWQSRDQTFGLSCFAICRVLGQVWPGNVSDRGIAPEPSDSFAWFDIWDLQAANMSFFWPCLISGSLFIHCSFNIQQLQHI